MPQVRGGHGLPYAQVSIGSRHSLHKAKGVTNYLRLTTAVSPQSCRCFLSPSYSFCIFSSPTHVPSSAVPVPSTRLLHLLHLSQSCLLRCIMCCMFTFMSSKFETTASYIIRDRVLTTWRRKRVPARSRNSHVEVVIHGVRLSLHTSIRQFVHLSRPAGPPMMLHAT